MMNCGCSVIALVLLAECVALGLSRLNTPKMRLNDNLLSCVPPSQSPQAARWLRRKSIYSRTVMNSLPTATLGQGDEETLQCALETDEGITDWSRPMRYVRRYSLLAAKNEQIIEVSPDDEFVHFSCNIQIQGEAMHHVERFEFIQDDSCEPSPRYQFYRLWPPTDWSANGSVHVDKKVDIFITDRFRVKLNLTAFPATNNTRYVKCAVRLAPHGKRIETCHKIQIATNSPACSTQQEKSSSFSLNFIEDICNNYKEGEAIRHLLKRDNCLKKSDFDLQMTCANQTFAHLQIRSTVPVTAAMLGELLSEVASVTTGVPDVPSTESSTLSSDKPMVLPSREPCSLPLPCNIAVGSGVGLLLLVLVLFLMLVISLIFNCMMWKKMYHKEELPQSSASTPTMGRQESTNNSIESVIINNSGQSMNLPRTNPAAQTLSHVTHPTNMTGYPRTDPVTVIRNSSVSEPVDIPGRPTTTTGPVVTQPHQASSESETSPSARVTTTPRILRRRMSPHSSTTRSPHSGTHSPVIDQQPTAMMQPFTQHNGGTPNVSANMPGEVFNVPGAAVISTSSAGDEMEQYGEQEESARLHQQAAPALNIVPVAPENHIQPGYPFQMENRSVGVWLPPFTPANCIPVQDCMFFMVPRRQQHVQPPYAGATASGDNAQFV